jgi:23S rRNA (adenine2503-C2)-methyltransferase
VFPAFVPIAIGILFKVYKGTQNQLISEICNQPLRSYLCSMLKTEQKNIRHLSLQDLEEYFETIGDKKFRAKQVYEWLWQKHAHSFADMTNLSKELRQKLGDNFTLPALTINATQYSADGTVKSSFKTHDGHLVEGVLIPTEKRATACVSSQIGCSLSCKFCATGYIDRSIERITSADGLGMSPKRITVSTAGVAKQIKQLGEDKVKFKLALSLHAANDKKRHDIMPINDSNNIKSLVDALNYFYKETKNEITFEYILFKNFNDSLKDADELIKIYRQVPADLINIIEYNPIEFAKFEKPDEKVVENFMAYLEKHKVNARLRRSRGKDIDAACGQLANKN